MSRKFLLSLAAATIIVTGLASTAADARGFGGGGHSFGGGGHSLSGARLGGGRLGGHSGRMAALGRGGRGGRGGHPGGSHGHPGRFGHDHHHRWITPDGVWIDGGYDEVNGAPDVAPAVTPASGPCTCLTKTYTRTGLVIFADVCTKEAASAGVDGTAADTAPPPPAEGKSSETTPTTPIAPADGKAADASKAPTSQNYAGRTYADYLAANQ
jgi:hypothetical protein